MVFLEFVLPVLYWILALSAGVTIWIVDRRARRAERGAEPSDARREREPLR